MTWVMRRYVPCSTPFERLITAARRSRSPRRAIGEHGAEAVRGHAHARRRPRLRTPRASVAGRAHALGQRDAGEVVVVAVRRVDPLDELGIAGPERDVGVRRATSAATVVPQEPAPIDRDPLTRHVVAASRRAARTTAVSGARTHQSSSPRAGAAGRSRGLGPRVGRSPP